VNSTIQILDDEVHIWTASLVSSSQSLQGFWGELSGDERAKASRYRFARDRDRYVAARGILRRLLREYTGIEPRTLQFEYSVYGKPSLKRGSVEKDFCFNLSHSRDITVYAITGGAAVGVDVEYIHPEMAWTEIAGNFFSREEVQALRRLPLESRTLGFFSCWTRKEAYIKARGEGLSLPLHHFQVSVDPYGPAELLSHFDDPSETNHWSLRQIVPVQGYMAAVAAQMRSFTILNRMWPSASLFSSPRLAVHV